MNRRVPGDRSLALVWALLALFRVPALRAAPSGVSVERRVAAMGTTLDVTVIATDREAGLAASELAISEVLRIEDLLTTWRDGPLSRLNRSAPGTPEALDRELSALLRKVLSWAARTDRSFDPTVAPLMRAWDLRGVGRIPLPGELAAALAATGAGRFQVDAARSAAVRLDPDAGIDEGAWGKGYALERAAARVAAAGASGQRIDLGGQFFAAGRDESGREWTVSIAHPRRRERPVLTLTLAEGSVSTSGNSERGRDIGGRRIGHELDPRTGEPAPDFGSATVVGPSALVADILSTAFFVLGPQKGLALSERLRGEGVAQDVLFLIDRGDLQRLEAVASPGFSSRVLSIDSTVLEGLTPQVVGGLTPQVAGRKPIDAAHP